MKHALIFTFVCLLCLNLSAQEVADSITGKVHELNEVVVIGNQAQQNNLLSPRMGSVSVTPSLIRNVTMLFGEADVLKALQIQPGVSTGVEGFAGMYVRGGENDENLYVLGNLPLYHVSHLGGMFSSFNVAAVSKVDFYKSGFPAAYGGRASSITDIQLGESDYIRLRGQVSLGLISGNLFVTAPILKDRLAFSVGLRRSWLDVITAPTLAIMNSADKKNGKKKIGRYAFGDLNLKLDYKWGERIKGYTHFYGGNDNLKIGEGFFSTGDDSPYEEENTTQLKWGNWGVSTGGEMTVGRRTLLTANAYYTDYSANFQQKQDEQNTYDGVTTKEYTHKMNTNGIGDLGVNVGMNHAFTDKYRVKLGMNYIYHSYLPEKLTIETHKQMNAQGTESAGRIKAHEAAVYADNEINLSKRWEASVGLRGVYYASAGKSHMAVEPRVNLRYSLTQDFSLKGGYARMTQFAQQICNSYISLPTDSWQPISDKWKPLTSDQISIGLYGNLPAGFYFAVEGYYKWLNNLLEYREGINAFSSNMEWNSKLTQGKGEAYGVDISLQRNVGKVTGSIGYSLLWNTRQFETLNKGKAFPSKYDNRHKLNITCNYRWSEKVELNVGWTYMTGNRVTLALNNYHSTTGSGFTEDMAPTGIDSDAWGLGYYSSRNNVRLPAYHRLDLGINIYQRKRKSGQGVWNISLYNAYSRMNPIAISKQGFIDMGGSGKWGNQFQTLGIFPAIPSVTYTYKF